MLELSLADDVIVPFMIFAIPVIAVAGGIMAGVIKTVSAHRLMEAAVRERMALVARGIDPSKIPPPGSAWLMSLPDSPRYRAQGLLIGGVVTLAGSLAWLGVVAAVGDWEDGTWGVAVIGASVALALIASAAIIWPRVREHAPGTAPHAG